MWTEAVATSLGRFFLRYGKFVLPVVVLAACSLSVPDDRIFGSTDLERVLDLFAAAVVLLGLALRVTAIGAGVGVVEVGAGSSVGAAAVGGENLVHDGIYALSRNPRYLGGLLVCLGIFLMHGSLAVILIGMLACILVYALMVRVEEAELRATYGERYSAYCAVVPRWLPDLSRIGTGLGRFSLRRALLADWPMIVAASLALILTEVHEYLPPAHATMSQTVLFLIAALSVFALIAVALRVSGAVVGGNGEATWREAPATRGILVDGRVRQVDRLENMLSLGQQEAILESTLAAAELRPGESLVDVGCGTGKLVVAAARMLGETRGAKNRLLGIDATPGMIDLALERAHEAGVKAEFQVGVAEELPLPDGAADAVTSSYFFHHLPSEVKPLALREMWRVLAPGGRLVITDYGRARGLYGLIASIPMRANFYEYVRPQLGGELERIIAAEGLGEAETVALYLGYITVMRLRKPA